MDDLTYEELFKVQGRFIQLLFSLVCMYHVGKIAFHVCAVIVVTLLQDDCQQNKNPQEF